MNFLNLEFRVWDEAHKRFFTKNELSFFPVDNKVKTLESIARSGIHLAILFGEAVRGGASMDVKDYEFELFTGFKDKNEKKIFEGDILHLNGGEICEVIFYKGAFCVNYHENQKEHELLSGLFLKLCKVVGNIHENRILNEKV